MKSLINKILPSLKGKLIFFFIVVLVVPIFLFLFLSLKATFYVALKDFQQKLQNALTLVTTTFYDNIDSLTAKVKTFADFELYKLADVIEKHDKQLLQAALAEKLIKMPFDYFALIYNDSEVIYEDGYNVRNNRNRLIIGLCKSSLSKNVVVINNDLWIFIGTELIKLRKKTSQNKYNIVIGVKLQRDFADHLKTISGADFSIIYSNKRIVTTKTDIYMKRLVGTNVEIPDVLEGEILVSGKIYYFLRQQLIPNVTSEPIFFEVSLPKSEFLYIASNLQKDLLIFASFGTMLAFLFAILLYSHITSPIIKLAEITTKISLDNAEIEIVTDRSDEIGMLYKNFTQMIKKLKLEQAEKNRRMKELQTLYEISNAINYYSDQEEFLKFLLTHTVEILRAERGSIMLLDDKTDELVVKVAIGGKYRIQTANGVKLGYGICGIVAKEGKGRICNSGFKDPNFKSFNSLLPVEDIRSLLCAPMKFKEGTIGVINIVNKIDGKEFNEDDLSLLTLIASQAAIAIENTKLYILSITDGLTKLYVYRYFMARLSEEILRARRYGLKLSIIMIDIDNFKSFNDTYGHQLGDQILQKVANIIRETIRGGIDIPCRYGGEELAIILPETRAEEAYITAERLRETIANTIINHPTGEIKITCSFGVASYPQDGQDVHELVGSADKALYVSKNTGKNKTTMASQIFCE